MSKKLQLSIAEPCHENWENMSPVEKGKFCGSCQKQVVDFSNMSDRLVAEFFKKPSTGSVCGRFMTDQLDRAIEIPKKRIPWFKYFFSFLLPAIFISKASAQQVKGKVGVATKDTTRKPIDHEFRTLGVVLRHDIIPVCKDTTDNRLVKGEVMNVESKVNNVRINGKVVDENGDAIPNVSIMIMNNGKVISADGSGKFSFQSSKEQLIELSLTSVGYQDEHYLYPFTLNYSAQVDINITMKTETTVMKEVVCYVMGGIKAEQVTGKVETQEIKIDSTKSREITPPIETFKILVYPNPVRPGTTINISFNQMEEGYYLASILSVSGQLVNQKEIWMDSKARVISLEAPQVTTGTYFLILTNKKTGKKFSEKLIIE